MKKILCGLVLGLTVLCATAFPALIIPDQYDMLFAQMNGTGNAFGDSSSVRTKTITAAGNATQLPIKFNKSAGFFNGTTDYVVVPDSSDFDFTGAFTIEMFVMFNSVGGAIGLWGDSTDVHYSFWNNGSGRIEWNNPGKNNTWTWAPAINTWYHLMFVRDAGNNLLVYVNGSALTPVAGGTVTGTLTCDTNLYIGKRSTYYLSGWMKELRISNVARTVAVPTSEYNPDANTKLLIHFDLPANMPLGPALYFDGTDASLTVANNADWNNLGNSDFTIEWYEYRQSNSNNKSPLFLANDSGNPTCISLGWPASGALSYYISSTGASYDIANARSMGTAVLNRWTHYALMRYGNNWYVFKDGVVIDSFSSSASFSAVNRSWYVAVDKSQAYWFQGFMREIRFSNVARYSAYVSTGFTPSQKPFVTDANTKLLIHGSDNNGTTSFTDDESSAKTITNPSSHTVARYTEDYRNTIFVDSESTPKFPYPAATGSARVDFFAIGAGAYWGGATGDYAYIESSTDFNMGSGDTTIEAYFRQDVLPTNAQYPTLISRFDNDANGAIFLSTTLSGGVYYVVWGDKYVNISGAYSPQQYVWYHLAYTRNGNVHRLFLNGTQVATATDANAKPDSTARLYIGACLNSADTNRYWKGRLDNVRIAKGYARYTSSPFNPPDDYSSARPEGMLAVF